MGVIRMKHRVLVVDDEKNIRKFITVNLEARGYEVIQAADGVEAISLLDSQGFDIILLDINMPRMDGFSVCRQVRRRFNTPIMMLSARQDVSADKARCLDLGADGYMTKPFRLRDFLDRIDSMIRRTALAASNT
jgi:DNA-binding response OmpR family regulator